MAKIPIYSPIQVAISSLLSGPCAAVFMVWKNFQGLGNSSGARQTMVWGTLLALLIFAILPFLPEKFPNSALPIGYTAVAMSIVRQHQLTKKAILESESYEVRSNWNVLGISIGCLLVSAAIALSWIFVLVLIGIVNLG
jgi:hypothetical protein